MSVMSVMSISDVEFIILGSGTSAGVPVIGCRCAVCTSDDPRNTRLRSAACVQFTDPSGTRRLILIDTGPDLRQQALRHGLSRCDAIVYTHNHVDHTFGLDEVRRFNVIMKAPIDVYAEERTLSHLGRVYRHIFDRQNNINDSFVETLIPHEIDEDHPLDLYGMRLTPLRLLHGRLPILGYRLDALDEQGHVAEVQPGPLPLAYCTDVSAIPPQTWGRLNGIVTLILDMLRYRRHATHFCLDEAVETAGRIAADRTWFIHMTHDIEHGECDDSLPEGMALSYDGLVLR